MVETDYADGFRPLTGISGIRSVFVPDERRGGQLSYSWDTCHNTLASLICPGEQFRVILASKFNVF